MTEATQKVIVEFGRFGEALLAKGPAGNGRAVGDSLGADVVTLGVLPGQDKGLGKEKACQRRPQLVRGCSHAGAAQPVTTGGPRSAMPGHWMRVLARWT